MQSPSRHWVIFKFATANKELVMDLVSSLSESEPEEEQVVLVLVTSFPSWSWTLRECRRNGCGHYGLCRRGTLTGRQPCQNVFPSSCPSWLLDPEAKVP